MFMSPKAGELRGYRGGCEIFYLLITHDGLRFSLSVMRSKGDSPMQKSIRSFALVAVIALTASPMYAHRSGCDPHPQAVVAAPSTLQVVASTVLSVLGY